MVRHSLYFTPRRSDAPRTVICEMFSTRNVFVRDGAHGCYEVLWDASTATLVHDLITHLVGPGDGPTHARSAWQRTDAFQVVTGWGPLYAFVTLPRTRAENDNTSEHQMRASTIGLLGASVALAIVHNETHGEGERVDVQYALDMLDELHGRDVTYAKHEIAEVGLRVREAIRRAETLTFIDPATGHEN